MIGQGPRRVEKFGQCVACDVWTKCPFARANGLPVGVKVLENVKVSEVVVWGVRLALGSACLKGLHLVVMK